ncbi:hypothetical protein Cri9333_4181 [Crinalium epipsammum PCC 9333]|uniref:Uncharacterized protein n=1 Tax=Crinalium epipsammum PCC 9333 TaxID=1173022 RepID=K9W3N7_9CYAN|nr:hypothetical protein Cri9333_4181 [Crinalium epipsammum PCC 9333]
MNSKYRLKELIKNVIRFSINQSVEKFCLKRNPKPHVRSGECFEIMFYWQIYEQMTGKIVKSTSIDTLIEIALEEWLERVDN